MAFDKQALIFGAKIVAPFNRTSLLLQNLDCISVVDAREWRLDVLQLRDVALELLQLRLTPLENARDDGGNEFLLQTHVVVRVVERDLGLDHPELSEVPTRLRLLSAKRRAKTVNLAEGRGCGFAIELAGLREIGTSLVKILRFEQPTAFADGAGEDWSVDEGEIALVKKVADRLLDFRPDFRDRTLAGRAKPEVTIVEQKIDPVLLRLDGI